MSAAESEHETCRIAHHDSRFWGVVCAQIYDPTVDNHGIEFGQLLLDASDVIGIQMSEDCGFRATDIRVTLDRPLNRRPPILIEEIRPAEPTDLEALVRIARESHRITRFYADPGFPDERCHDYYEGWIRNSVDGWADQVLVAGVGPVGYVTVHLEGDTASIGLIAVDERLRGQGVGQRLCHGAFRWAQAAGATRMTVVTQGRNIAAQRLFQRCGFLTRSTEVWMHRWFR